MRGFRYPHNAFQFLSGGLPLRRQFLQPFLHVDEFAVDFHRLAGLLIGVGLFQFGGQFRLLVLQRVNLLFEAMNELLVLLVRARTGLALFGFEALLILGLRGRADSRCGPRRFHRVTRRQGRPRGGGGGFVQVILVIAGVMRQAPGIDMQDVAGQRADEINVVADEDERAVRIASAR